MPTTNFYFDASDINSRSITDISTDYSSTNYITLNPGQTISGTRTFTTYVDTSRDIANILHKIYEEYYSILNDSSEYNKDRFLNLIHRNYDDIKNVLAMIGHPVTYSNERSHIDCTNEPNSEGDEYNE